MIRWNRGRIVDEAMDSFRLKRFFSKSKPEAEGELFLPVQKQTKAWQEANRKMGWGIKEDEFGLVEEPPLLTADDRRDGFLGVCLFYGFGDDGQGHPDAALSGKLAWEYARRRKKRKTWHCEYVHFDEPEHIRLRPGAPPRPKGFYFAKIQTGERFQALTVSQVRKGLLRETGCGPEGFQFLAITHPHFQALMNERKIPFMAFADYDIAPYGYEDFFDAPQMFCSNGILGLGIGHVDRNYPLFGIPTLRF